MKNDTSLSASDRDDVRRLEGDTPFGVDLDDTFHLLSSDANRERLRHSMAQLENGDVIERELPQAWSVAEPQFSVQAALTSNHAAG